METFIFATGVMGAWLLFAATLIAAIASVDWLIATIKRRRQAKRTARAESKLLAALEQRFLIVKAHRDYQAGEAVFVDRDTGQTFDRETTHGK